MIASLPSVRVLMATKPVDLPKGASGLAALIKDEMKTDLFSGVVYMFRAKRADRIKLLYWDGTGVVLTARTLEQGGFRWPKLQDGVMRLTATQVSGSWTGSPGRGFTALAERARRSRRTDSRRTRGVPKGPVGTWSTPGVTGLADALPDDVETLKTMLLAERARAERLRTTRSSALHRRAVRGSECLRRFHTLIPLVCVQPRERGGVSGLMAPQGSHPPLRPVKKSRKASLIMTDKTMRDGPADQDFILTCYEVFLGRELDTLDVIRDRAGWPESEVIHSIVGSSEFAEHVLPALETGYPFIGDRFHDEPSLRHRMWVTEQLPLTPDSKAEVLTCQSWRSLLTLIVNDNFLSNFIKEL